MDVVSSKIDDWIIPRERENDVVMDVSSAAAENWIIPNYSFVDVYEYEMEIDKKRDIEDFCIRFFKDWEIQRDASITTNTSNFLVNICQQVVKEQKGFEEIMKTLPTSLTLNNFNDKFQAMCNALFENGTGVRDVYVVSLLAFSTGLHREMQGYEWYNWKLLFTSLTYALEKVNFNPRVFDYNQSSASLQSIFTSFIIIIPPLLFFYILSR